MLVQTDFGTARTIPTETFLCEVLPSLNQGIKIDESIYTPKSTFRNVGPELSSPRKDRGTSTSPFVDYTTRLAEREPTMSFHDCDSSTWIPGHLNVPLASSFNTVLPDVYSRLDHRDGITCKSDTVGWASCVVPGIFSSGSTNYNTIKAINRISQCLAECMLHDVRRRFVYGFHITNGSKLNLWYCDRAQLVFTEDIDLAQDWRILVDFLLRVIYAYPVQLGFDPTITPLKDEDGATQYDITVRTDTGEEYVYRTIQLLSTIQLDMTIGRGTRVWKAAKVENGHTVGEPVVLKDCWVLSGRDREGKIYARIHQSTRTPEDARVLRSGLLTVLCHGDVFVSGTQDRTRTLKGHPISRSPLASLCDQLAAPAYQAHYRIVFQEIGKDLEREASPAAAFKALKDVVCCLDALHNSGWVHADLNDGNIIICRDGTRLADLELASREGEPRAHDYEGTPFFGAVEVLHHKYLFKPSDRQSTPVVASSSIDPTFTHNPLHDMEGLWWTAVYSIATKGLAHRTGQLEPSNHSRWSLNQLVDFLFEDDESYNNRTLTFISDDQFKLWFKVLHSSLPADAVVPLQTLREKLIGAYRKAEENMPTLPSYTRLANGLHREFACAFGIISQKMEEEHANSVMSLGAIDVPDDARPYFLPGGAGGITAALPPHLDKGFGTLAQNLEKLRSLMSGP